jgi:hypothetical protein
MTFVPKGNRNLTVASRDKSPCSSPSLERGRYLEETHDGTGGIPRDTRPHNEKDEDICL